MTITLSSYITDAQRLLHDASNRFWSQTELIDYANKARKLIAAETGCTRQVVNFDIAAATTLAGATYSMDTIIAAPVARRIFDILDILLLYSNNTVYQLRYLPYSSAVRTGIWQIKYAGTPTHYTINNRQVILLQWPAIAYAGSSIDCLVEPLDLVDLTDPDTDIAFPYTECVGFYMAHLAKLKDQRRDEAEAFFKDYQRRKVQAIGAEFTRRLVNT